MKFSINDIFRFLRIWSLLLKKPLMENFTFCAMFANSQIMCQAHENIF